VSALEVAVVNSPVPVTVISRDVGRYSSPVEAAAYFCCLEAVQNAAKHAGAATIRVELRAEPGSLVCVIDDDGAGFEPDAVSAGSGLANMRDRVESVGGRLGIATSGSGGARIQAWLPVEGS